MRNTTERVIVICRRCFLMLERTTRVESHNEYRKQFGWMASPFSLLVPYWEKIGRNWPALACFGPLSFNCCIGGWANPESLSFDRNCPACPTLTILS